MSSADDGNGRTKKRSPPLPGLGVFPPHPGDAMIPSQIEDMEVTPFLRNLYRGIPKLVYVRAEHSPQCRKPFDCYILCQRQLLNSDICREVNEIYETCRKQWAQRKYLARKREENRKDVISALKSKQERQSNG
eukprot:gb/GECG01010159.1/.p1 GENE.gb/GECG01010159.1/~~gb/GECG01010159.1/.p1  ORF type:complete len:133 (+),score=20.66 gb/GECG01010159.1/:1-399(+)